MNILQILDGRKIIPVAVFETVYDGLKTCEVLVSGGMTIVEIAARTPETFECIKNITLRFPELTVGAGSLYSRELLESAAEAGAAFGVAPGFDSETAGLAALLNFPFVPGASTPTEIMAAMKTSELVKIFPAQLLGGPEWIRAAAAPFAGGALRLLPTGGITPGNVSEYLKLPSVAACGMSWLTDSRIKTDDRYEQIAARLGQLKEAGLCS